jgi:hypothetical protein
MEPPPSRVVLASLPRHGRRAITSVEPAGGLDVQCETPPNTARACLRRGQLTLRVAARWWSRFWAPLVECGRLSLPQIATNAEATNTSPNSSPHADQPTATMLPPLTRASAVEKRIIGAPQHRANRVGSDRFQRGNEKTPSAGQCRQGLSRFARYLVRAAVTRDLRLGSRTLSGAFTNGMVLEGPTMKNDAPPGARWVG